MLSMESNNFITNSKCSSITFGLIFDNSTSPSIYASGTVPFEICITVAILIYHHLVTFFGGDVTLDIFNITKIIWKNKTSNYEPGSNQP